MNDEKNGELRLTVSQEYSVLQPGPQNAYLVAEDDWTRIKRIVGEVVPAKSTYQTVSSVCAGIFISSISALLFLKLSTSSVPNWAWTTVICSTICSLLLAIAFFIFDSQQNQGAVRTVGSILRELEEIEKSYTPTGLPRNSSPRSNLIIMSARYGAGNTWRDVTAKLASTIQEGRLRVAITNETLGGDPVPNVVKKLEITYAHDGKKYTQTVPENGLLSIP